MSRGLRSSKSVISMIVRVPKPAGKINKDRPINTLLEHQVRRLRETELRHIPRHRTGLAVDPSKMTEGEAANYIRQMTAKIHELGPKPVAIPIKTKRKKATSRAKAKPAKRVAPRKNKIKVKAKQSRRSK